MKKNIILLSNAYWPSIGGIENSLRHLAQEAQSAGDNVLIVVSDIGVPKINADRFSTVIDGVQVLRYPISPYPSFILRPFNLLASHWALYRLLNKAYESNKNTIVIARFHFCALVAVWAGFKHTRYLVPSINAHQYSEERRTGEGFINRTRVFFQIGLHNIVQRAALRRCHNFVFSETMRSQCANLAGNLPCSYILTKPGVDQCRFNVAREEERTRLKRKLRLPIDTQLVLFVGRFVKAKGVDILIESIGKVNENCHLVLVGDGTERAQYIKTIKMLNLTTRISITKPTRKIEDYYRCADLFVMSSRYEPLGQTLLEAFSSGLPVVAFKRGPDVDTATQELAMERHVTYAKNLSADSLADAISLQLKNMVKHRREVVSAEARKKFCWTKLYQNLVND